MANLRYLLLLLPILFFGQNKPIKINIVSVTSIDSIPEERKFTINYSIENTTDKEISFFLEPEKLFPAHTNPMGTSFFYKLFQGKDELIIDGVFTEKKFTKTYIPKDYSNIIASDREKTMQKDFEEFIKKQNDSLEKLAKDGETKTDVLKRGISNRLMNTVYTLKPNETKIYSIVWYWDKTRYFKRDEFEYYLDEKGTFYIQFYLFLMKEDYRNKMTKEDYEKLMKISNFIKGVYQSEKVEINFRE